MLMFDVLCPIGMNMLMLVYRLIVMIMLRHVSAHLHDYAQAHVLMLISMFVIMTSFRNLTQP